MRWIGAPRSGFDAVDRRFEEMNERLAERFDAVDRRFEEMGKRSDERFEEMGKRSDERFAAVNVRFEDMNKRFEDMKQALRFDAVAGWRSVRRARGHDDGLQVHHLTRGP